MMMHRMQSEVWAELERNEAVALRTMARRLTAAARRGDDAAWDVVRDVARAMRDAALVKDPPDGGAP